MWDRQSVAVVGITLLAAFLRFFLIGDKSVWLDEAFSIWLARHPLGEMWGWLVRIDQHPPLYYTLLHGWVALFGDLQGAVRTLSALCSALTVPIFYAGVRRLIDPPTALIAAFLLAVSPFHVRFAQEARMYSLLALAVAVAIYCLARIVTEKDAPRRVWWGLAVSQAAAMLTHNTAAVYFPLALNLAVAAIFFNAEAQRRKGAEPIRANPFNPRHPRSILRFEFVRHWLIFQGAALLLWSPWAWPFVVQSTGVDRQFWIPAPTAATVWETFRNFNFAFLPDFPPLVLGGMALYSGLAILGVWRLRGRPTLWILLCLLVVPLLIALLVSLRRPVFYERTLIWLTLPYYALIAAGIRAVGSKTRRRIQVNDGVNRPVADVVRGACTGTRTTHYALGQHLSVYFRRATLVRSVQTGMLAVVLFLSALSLNGYYSWFEKEGWDDAATYVSQQVQPDDLIIFHATWVQIPFDYYYRRHEQETERRGLPVDLFDQGVLEPQMAESDVAYLRQLVADRPRIWLVYSHEWYTDPQQIIPREMARSLREVERREFIGLEVIRYEAR